MYHFSKYEIDFGKQGKKILCILCILCVCESKDGHIKQQIILFVIKTKVLMLFLVFLLLLPLIHLKRYITTTKKMGVKSIHRRNKGRNEIRNKRINHIDDDDYTSWSILKFFFWFCFCLIWLSCCCYCVIVGGLWSVIGYRKLLINIHYRFFCLIASLHFFWLHHYYYYRSHYRK